MNLKQTLLAPLWLLSSALVVTASAQTLTDYQQREADSHFRAGMEALVSEEYEKAETEFQEAVRIDPLFDAAFYGLGQVYMATKRYEKAVKAYRDSREAFQTSSRNRLLQGAESDRRLRDQIQALQDYVRNLQRLPAVSRGGISTQNAIDRVTDQIRQLEGRLNRSIGGGLPPVPAGLSLALGSAYFRLSQWAAAEREYKAAVAVNPRYGEAHNNLAVVYMLTGRLVEAEEEIKLAEKAGFRVNPKFKDDLRGRKNSRM